MSAGNHECRHGMDCPDCGAPNRFCICVLTERLRGAAKREREASAERARYRALFMAAASCLAYNRARLAKPRGPDEARLLAHIEEGGLPGLGMFWSGKTDGWIQDEMFTDEAA